ncbi:MAG: YgiQ family radical SAM protein [Deltaproteobacteria bacterium]|nr:YgiQ family radical SAM protein [Deltaproteobacteria bacterium]
MVRGRSQDRIPQDTGFLPVSAAEMTKRGWEELDVLFVNGDAYVDHPSFGVPLLARLLEREGLRVGILAQPDWRDPETFRIMGRPRLFAALSSGAMDSMVNHYTAAKKLRRDDAYTPGGKAGRRPNRALIAYTAAVKAAFPGLFVVIGGIEASLRRLAHYDYWDDRVRRSILFDTKADLLVYGMGEKPLLEIARAAAAGEPLERLKEIRGTAVIRKQPPEKGLELPSFEAVRDDREAFGRAFRLAAEADDPRCDRILLQPHGGRWLAVNPPAPPLTEKELDAVYDLPFMRLPHPGYREPIPAYEQIKFSITSHRGCGGGCAFCAIARHQGKRIQSRSEKSILKEIAALTRHPEFKGTVTDIGGPTANMYGLICAADRKGAPCRRESCLWPRLCPQLRLSDERGAKLLEKARRLAGVSHVFVASGLRCDLLREQPAYFQELLSHHVGGLLKVAPETLAPEVAAVMRKPSPERFAEFLAAFRDGNRFLGVRRGVVPYLISAHPGCTLSHMVDTALFLKRCHLTVEQVQEFTPTPGTLATCMFHTGKDPFTGEELHIPRSEREKRLQKSLLLWHLPEKKNDIREALRLCGREKDGAELLETAGLKKLGPRKKAPRDQ